MKRLLFMMVIVNTITISTLSSCNKMIVFRIPLFMCLHQKAVNYVNLTANHWAAEGNGVFVNAFAMLFLEMRVIQ